jgi:hypothetical protein
MSVPTLIRRVNYRYPAAILGGALAAAVLCALLVPAVLAVTAPPPAPAETSARGSGPDFWSNGG